MIELIINCDVINSNNTVNSMTTDTERIDNNLENCVQL